MNIERLFLLDPYNDSHLEKITVFEKENKCLDQPSLHIKEIRDNILPEEYYDTNKNEFEKILFTEKTGKMTDCCYISGEKDRKICYITPLNISNKNKTRYLPELATNYALDTLGMLEAFVNVSEEDNNMINYLELKDFENIGEVDGRILLLKEKVEKENSQRMI